MASKTYYERGDTFVDVDNKPAIVKKGNQLTFTDDFKAGGGDELAPATANALGGVIIGSGVDVTSDGTISVTPPAYSTTEHLTGRKWINGKDIYEKTIELSITSIESESVVIVSNIDYVDTLIDSNFTVQKTNVKGCERACVYVSANNELKIHTIERWTDIVSSQVTIQYTKSAPIKKSVKKG